MASEYDELGLKVQRAQHALEKIRGTGSVDGVTVEVDAENRLVAVSGSRGETIMAAYLLAVRDLQPRVAEALRELAADPQVTSAMVFTEANAAHLEAERVDRAAAEVDEYFERSW
ncbi:hypothetical protein [Nocardia sp. NPDC127526]|uniref:hypothetical protein n=1 Tax=Nocardia sp. NPDC127526 TaxID=3345393 RepID=UPI003633BD64